MMLSPGPDYLSDGYPTFRGKKTQVSVHGVFFFLIADKNRVSHAYPREE